MAVKRKSPKTAEVPELKELIYIRKLLMAQLAMNGVDSTTLGKILGLDGSTVRHMIPFSALNTKEK